MKAKTRELFEVIFEELKITSNIPHNPALLYQDVGKATHVESLVRAELMGIIHALDKKPEKDIQQNLVTFYTNRL
ncbi:MAG: hypothetical protein AAFR61_15300 [Bacteroidota bacterium]